MANPVVLRNPIQLLPLVVAQQAVNDSLAAGCLAQGGSLHSAKHCGPIGNTVQQHHRVGTADQQQCNMKDAASNPQHSVLQTSSNAT